MPLAMLGHNVAASICNPSCAGIQADLVAKTFTFRAKSVWIRDDAFNWRARAGRQVVFSNSVGTSDEESVGSAHAPAAEALRPLGSETCALIAPAAASPIASSEYCTALYIFAAGLTFNLKLLISNPLTSNWNPSPWTGIDLRSSSIRLTSETDASPPGNLTRTALAAVPVAS